MPETRLRADVEFVGGLVEWDGQFLTSCGSLGTIEFTLELIARFAGRRVADMVVDLTGRRGVTGQFEPPSTPLEKAIQTMRNNIETPMPIEEISSSAGISQRQLARQFQAEFSTSPIRYYVELRLEFADELLRKTRFSVSDIAASSGFSSPSWFSQNYSRKFGYPPSAMRTRG